MTGKVICPICGQIDQVEKVSTIYLMGIGLERLTPAGENQTEKIAFNPEFEQLPAASLKALSRRLAPPSTPAQIPIRPIHPDMVVLAFSLVVSIFLYGILTSQSDMLLPVLAILAVFYLFYFWRRKTILAKFEKQQVSRKSTAERINQGVERWIKLYYCLRDDGVFEEGMQEVVPADQMPGLLFGNISRHHGAGY